MSRNIKEIGKELMGKSLNSFHRKTGLTQLEENNKMQDGILDGILSQVDDAYIEKTEQSNVIHLDGSGDGVVVLDSIEGNTMVNLLPSELIKSVQSDNENFIIKSTWLQLAVWHKTPIKANATYTLVVDIIEKPSNVSIRQQNNSAYIGISTSSTDNLSLGRNIITITTSQCDRVDNMGHNYLGFLCHGLEEGQRVVISKNMILVEGNQVDKVSNYFEGLQSSFEEKVNDEGKYEIEILSNNRNIYVPVQKRSETYGIATIENGVYKTNPLNSYGTFGMCNHLNCINDEMFNGITKLKKGVTYTYSCKIRKTSGTGLLNYFSFFGFNKSDKKYMHSGLSSNGSVEINNEWKEITYTKTSNIDADVAIPAFQVTSNAENCVIEIKDIQLEISNSKSNYIPRKSNKIKLLINEPLRGINNISDRLCIKNGKLVIERNYKSKLYDGLSCAWQIFDVGVNRQFYAYLNDVEKSIMSQNSVTSINDRYSSTYFNNRGNISARNCALMTFSSSNKTNLLCVYKSQDVTLEQFKTELNNNPMVMVYQLEEPVYEEVLNEYGEPILLEGYENGTIYIDSTIAPTTTVRYTPKMESFKTLKEVNNNNIMLTNDVNDNIIPYMMDVDLMIMEKEMALMSHQYKLRRIGESDMTSMQKRTQDMLERLIKGKTLTEQECKTRVTTYLNAGKITDAQAEELMLLISEVYA